MCPCNGSDYGEAEKLSYVFFHFPIMLPLLIFVFTSSWYNMTTVYLRLGRLLSWKTLTRRLAFGWPCILPRCLTYVNSRSVGLLGS